MGRVSWTAAAQHPHCRAAGRAACCACSSSANGARWIALIATLARLRDQHRTCGSRYDPNGAQWQFVEKVPLGGGINWALGIDGIALVLIALTAFLMPICIGASWRAIEKRVPEYMAYFLLMEALIMGSFAAQDLFLFYIFFEGGLIPMYLIIGIWGGAERIKASYKFFLYTLFGSVLMLIAMLYMAGDGEHDVDPGADGLRFPEGSADLPVPGLPRELRGEAADVAGPHLVARRARAGADSGLGDPRRRAAEARRLRLHPLLAADVPGRVGAVHSFAVRPVSGIAVVYTSLVALVQRDMKKLIAYSSVAHMAFVTFGLFAMNRQGIEGAMLVMLGHGLVSGALFLCVGVVYDRLHTREIAAYGGLSDNMPGYALLFMVFTMASVGLPGTSNFPGEFLSLVGTYRASSWAAIVATTGIILGAAYMLFLYWRICFGVARTPEAAAMKDLDAREWWLLAPIAAGGLLDGHLSGELPASDPQRRGPAA